MTLTPKPSILDAIADDFVAIAVAAFDEFNRVKWIPERPRVSWGAEGVQINFTPLDVPPLPGWKTTRPLAVLCQEAIARTLRKRSERMNIETGEVALPDQDWFAPVKKEHASWLDGCPQEFGDGWCDLIAAMLTWIDEAIPDEDRQFFAFSQIKEKYGTLHAYNNAQDPGVEEIIEAFEIISGGICDVCGAPGTMRPDGWMRVRCDAHAKNI